MKFEVDRLQYFGSQLNKEWQYYFFKWRNISVKPWTNFSWQDRLLVEFSTLKVAACHAMHLLHNIAIWPNLELKTWPKQLFGSFPLDIVLPVNPILWIQSCGILVSYSCDITILHLNFEGSFSCFVYKDVNAKPDSGFNQCLLRERLVTQLCLHIWLGGMPMLLACPQVMSFWPS